MRRPRAMAVAAALLVPALAPLALPRVASAQEAAVAPQAPGPAEYRAEYDRRAPGWPALPDPLRLAFAAAEDRQFFDRPAARSTITRRVAAALIMQDGGRFDRMVLGIALAQALSPDEILDWYVSEVYLGQGCYGAAGAAQAYYGKPLGDLTPEEMAYLAALPIAPTALHPVQKSERALARRNFVLGEMAKAGNLTQAEAEQATARPLVTRDPLGRCDPE
ncbi:hypothetical protein E0K89_009590 [Aquicoccus sp. SCR17]|nr:hypothetical protein [Carideicomes alvinocaridis]